MKLNSYISSSLHKFITITLVMGILSFPVVSMIFSLHHADNSFIELHDDKDTGEQDKLEENSKNEKKDLQIANIGFGNSDDLKAIESYRLYGLKRDIVLEIPIPPPDFI